MVVANEWMRYRVVNSLNKGGADFLRAAAVCAITTFLSLATMKCQ